MPAVTLLFSGGSCVLGGDARPWRCGAPHWGQATALMCRGLLQPWQKVIWLEVVSGVRAMVTPRVEMGWGVMRWVPSKPGAAGAKQGNGGHHQGSDGHAFAACLLGQADAGEHGCGGDEQE